METTVTESALVQRLNRKLAPGGTAIRKARERWTNTLGDFYEVDLERNCVVSTGLDCATLVKWGRELGALRPAESLDGLQGV